MKIEWLDQTLVVRSENPAEQRRIESALRRVLDDGICHGDDPDCPSCAKIARAHTLALDEDAVPGCAARSVDGYRCVGAREHAGPHSRAHGTILWSDDGGRPANAAPCWREHQDPLGNTNGYTCGYCDDNKGHLDPKPTPEDEASKMVVPVAGEIDALRAANEIVERELAACENEVTSLRYKVQRLSVALAAEQKDRAGVGRAEALADALGVVEGRPMGVSPEDALRKFINETGDKVGNP